MRRRKRVPTDGFEHFRFTVDAWYRAYLFEINRHKWELAPHHHRESDALVVSGRLRGTTRRKFTHGELHLIPFFVRRDELSDKADRIGNVWVEKGKLCASAWIPADVYFSLPSTLASVAFAEMRVRIRDLRYNKGALDAIDLSHDLIPLESD